jgi:hypothetical protein
MRHVLVLLGVLGIALGIIGAHTDALLLAGVILFAIGVATCDIVSAIRGLPGTEEGRKPLGPQQGPPNVYVGGDGPQRNRV